MEKKKLTSDNMTWSHFAPRKRYLKNDDGVVVGARYDRLFIGLRPAGRAWLESHYSGDGNVMVLMLGHNNVVFLHREGESTVFVNSKAGAQAREYINFYIKRLDLEKGIKAVTIPVDDLPTQTIIRTRAGGVDSLDAAIAAACGRDIADLGI